MGRLDAPLTGLREIHTGYVASTDNIQTLDKLLTSKAIEAFAKINLRLMIPPDVQAKRTLFVRQVDEIVGTKKADDIKTEIIRLQPDIKIDDVIKISNKTHFLKK